MAYIAGWWTVCGFRIEVARATMTCVAALALVGLFRVAERAAGRRVAWATIVCTALYPVFFAQTTLAHLDMAAAAFTFWALDFYLPPGDLREGGVVDEGRADGRRRAASVALFAGAAMAKETALLAPFALFGWE